MTQTVKGKKGKTRKTIWKIASSSVIHKFRIEIRNKEVNTAKNPSQYRSRFVCEVFVCRVRQCWF